MLVDDIIFCGTAWVGFLGHRRSKNVSLTTPSENDQYLEIFSQKNLGVCLHTIKVEEESHITDVAVNGVDIFALASADGSVTVK